MADTAPERSTRRPLDERALAHTVGRLRRAAQPPWLHAESARRMAERLPVIRTRPDVVVDWWSALGASRDALVGAYPKARHVAVEPVAPAAGSRPWWSPRRWAAGGPDVVAEDALVDGAAQLVWANMALHWCADPVRLMTAWRRALAVDGFLMFSTFGPGTLESLGAIYRRAGWPAPFAPFVDMHDLGDMLVEAGFADPVMDQETLTLTWPDAAAALAELRALGGNVASARFGGLRTPRWQQRLQAALVQATAGGDGRPALRFEIVYGHAFKPAPRVRVAGETRVTVDALRAMARTGRSRG
jgi:malonyl-CoA O-methyltransferase